MRSLRSTPGIQWRDKITNIEILDRAETSSIKAQLRWAGRVIRMEDYGIPKQLLLAISVLAKGTEDLGRPQKCFKTA